MEVTSEHFNKWMENCIENPEQYEREYIAIMEFLAEKKMGEPPTYGERCIAYLESLELG